jgi:outer membrane protein TolC
VLGVAPAPAATLTLDEAIHLALERNQQIKVDAYSNPIARADLLAAYGKFDPALTFRRSYSEDGTPFSSNPLVAQLVQTDNYSLALEGTTPWGLNYSLGGTSQNQRIRPGLVPVPDSYLSFGGITVTQPLLRGFGFGSNLLGVRIAKADRSIADWQFRDTVITTVTNVIGAYSDLAFAQQSLQIAQRSRELAAGLLAENEKRFKIGDLSESDVVQARARTAIRDQGILLAQQGVRDSANYLRKLIGETQFPINPESIELAPAELPAPKVDPASDLQTALNQRPEYQAARLGIVKRRANESAMRNQLLPQVDFVGSYGYNGLDRDFSASRRMVADRENRSYSAGVVVSVPLTFSEGRGKLRSARLSRRQAEADLVRLEQDIAVEVAHAAGQIETSQKRVTANRVAYDLAKQALDAEIKKLRAGTSSTYYVLGLQEELASAEYNYYASLADERRANASYEQALGRTLITYHIPLAKN